MRKTITAVLAAALLLVTSACTSTNSEFNERKQAQDAITLENSLEKAQIERKLKNENDPNSIRYVYLISFAQPVGYYVIKGKVSSSGSQLAPEQEAFRRCSGCEWLVMDSAQDDGTYGSGDPGNFFYLADGTLVTTTLDYIESTQPLPLQVPLLGE